MTTLRHCRLETDAEGIAWLTLDKDGSSANTLSSDMLQEAAAVLAQLEAAPPRGLVVRSAKRSGLTRSTRISPRGVFPLPIRPMTSAV